MTTPMVDAINVGKSFAGHRALDGVTLQVHPGQVVCIIGPSGSGKTTFLRCVNQLERFDTGALWLDGELVGYRQSNNRLHPLRPPEIARQRRATGMVFQRFNLFPHMTALQNITEGPIQVLRQPRDQATQTAQSLLTRVGLAHKAHAYPAQLSGGQQQRVAIARSLAMNPKLMLFDEPTSALDPELVGEVLQVIRDLAQSGMTMLIVTHELNFAREVAHQITFMDEGRVIESAPPQSLLTNPQHPRTQAFLSAVLA